VITRLLDQAAGGLRQGLLQARGRPVAHRPEQLNPAATGSEVIRDYTQPELQLVSARTEQNRYSAICCFAGLMLVGTDRGNPLDDLTQVVILRREDLADTEVE